MTKEWIRVVVALGGEAGETSDVAVMCKPIVSNLQNMCHYNNTDTHINMQQG